MLEETAQAYFLPMLMVAFSAVETHLAQVGAGKSSPAHCSVRHWAEQRTPAYSIHCIYMRGLKSRVEASFLVAVRRPVRRGPVRNLPRAPGLKCHIPFSSSTITPRYAAPCALASSKRPTRKFAGRQTTAR